MTGISIQDQRRVITALVLSCLLHVLFFSACIRGETTGQITQLLHQDATSQHLLQASLRTARHREQPVRSATTTPTLDQQHLDLLPLPTIPYYPTEKLTRRPQPLGAADLDAPDITRIIASGNIIIKLWIDNFGEVNQLEVEQSQLPDELSRLTVAAFKHLKFTPGEINGQPVGSLIRIEVNYDDVRSAMPRS